MNELLLALEVALNPTLYPALADNCDECVTQDSAVTCLPIWVQARGNDSVRAGYRCGNCRHEWTTSFLLDGIR